MKLKFKIIFLAAVISLMTVTPVTGCEKSGQPTRIPANFHSDKFHLSINLPEGWGSAAGPEGLDWRGRFTGQVAFNSWGEAGFWARAVQDGNSLTYSAAIMASQLPAGGAYAALVLVQGPPRLPGDNPPEYASNDLTGLLTAPVWSFDARNGPQFINFFKWEKDLQLEIGYKSDSSDCTVTQLNNLLKSWSFDAVPAGDAGWAVTVARRLLPEQVGPAKFSSQSGTRSDQTAARRSEVEERKDKTVHFRFTYFWNLPPPVNVGPPDPPSNTYHWWEIDVLPSGKAVLTAQGGVPL